MVTGQSAFELHAVAAALAQVSHWHCLPAALRHGGFAADKVRVFVPVVLVRSIFSVAMMPPTSGGQSRLVAPHSTFGETPLMSHALPFRCPAEHVPPRAPSLALPSPRQRGHGSERTGPLKTFEIKTALVAEAPDSTFAVPVIVPLIWLPIQVDTPPAASGR